MLSPPPSTPPPPSLPPLPSPPASSAQSPPSLTLTGVLYFGGNEGKSIELFASAAIPDLSAYSLGVASNGRADEIDYTLPAESAAAGQHIWVARGTNDQFRSEYGRNATYASAGSWISFNGDDNVLLWTGGSVVDRYGVANTDGTGEPWEYSAGTILYRASNTRPTAAFDLAQWRVETSADALGTFEVQPPPPSSPPAPAPPSSAPRLPPPSTSFPPSPPPASSAQPPSGPVEYSWYCAEDPTKSSRYPVCDTLCAGGEVGCHARHLRDTSDPASSSTRTQHASQSSPVHDAPASRFHGRSAAILPETTRDYPRPSSTGDLLRVPRPLLQPPHRHPLHRIEQLSCPRRRGGSAVRRPETLPRQFRDRHLRDTSKGEGLLYETPPRYFQTPPKYLRDTSKTLPRRLRDKSEAYAASPLRRPGQVEDTSRTCDMSVGAARAPRFATTLPRCSRLRRCGGCRSCPTTTSSQTGPRSRWRCQSPATRRSRTWCAR